MGRHNLNATITASPLRDLADFFAQCGEPAFWTRSPGRHSRSARESRSEERDAGTIFAEAYGRVGRTVRVGAHVSQKVSAAQRVVSKIAIAAAVLISRFQTYRWELRQSQNYWEEWKRGNEGATEEFALVLHGIPRVRNNN